MIYGHKIASSPIFLFSNAHPISDLQLENLVQMIEPNFIFSSCLQHGQGDRDVGGGSQRAADRRDGHHARAVAQHVGQTLLRIRRHGGIPHLGAAPAQDLLRGHRPRR